MRKCKTLPSIRIFVIALKLKTIYFHTTQNQIPQITQTGTYPRFHKIFTKPLPSERFHLQIITRKQPTKIPQTCFSIFHTKHMFLKFHKKAQRLPTSQAQHYKPSHKCLNQLTTNNNKSNLKQYLKQVSQSGNHKQQPKQPESTTTNLNHKSESTTTNLNHKLTTNNNKCLNLITKLQQKGCV